MIALIDSGQNGHVECGACDLRITGITRAGFGAAGTGSTEGRFRRNPNATGSGIMLMLLNGDYLVSTAVGAHTPRVVSLFGGAQQDGAPWENTLGQIGEPWIAFNVIQGSVSPIVGRLPGGLVVHKGFVADTTPAFQFDNKQWVVWGTGVVQNANGALGTLCFRTDDAADPPECVAV